MNSNGYRFQNISKDDPNYWSLTIEQYMHIRAYMTQQEFCAAKGILPNVFKGKLYHSPEYTSQARSLDSDTCSKAQSDFITAEIIDEEESRAASYDNYRLVFNNFEVIIPSNFDSSSLKRLVGVLG